MLSSGQTEKCGKGEEQVQEHAHNFSLTSRRLFINNSSWQAKQSIPHTTVTVYGDCVKICEDITPNFCDIRISCCITTTHLLKLPFLPGNFHQNQHSSRHSSTLFITVSWIEDKIERPPF
jgi:hypothetical protein